MGEPTICWECGTQLEPEYVEDGIHPYCASERAERLAYFEEEQE